MVTSASAPTGPALAKGSVGVIEGRCRTERPGGLSGDGDGRRGRPPYAVPLTAGPKVRMQVIAQVTRLPRRFTWSTLHCASVGIGLAASMQAIRVIGALPPAA